MPSSIAYSDSEVARIKELWCGGSSIRDIATATGRSESALHSFMAKHRSDFPIRYQAGKQRRWDAIERVELQSLYADDTPLDEIARQLGRSVMSVKNQLTWLGLWGGRTTTPETQARDRVEALVAALEAGKTVAEAWEDAGYETSSGAYQALTRFRRRGGGVPDLNTPDRRVLRRDRAMDALRRLRARRYGTNEPLILQSEHLPWLAGVLDARGTLQLAKNMTPVITVSSTRRALVAQMYLMTGLGGVHRYPSRRGKVSWVWRTGAADDVSAFLREIMPYLHVRRGMARILMGWPLPDPTTGRLSDDARQRRAALLDEMAYLRAVEDMTGRGES